MKLSVVASLYQSAPYIHEFLERAAAAAQAIVQNDYELILVNDGSPDDSLQKAVEQAKLDPHIVVIDLSRNFGHHKAMMTGLAHAKGEHIFLIDSDLEEEPEWLIDFADQMKAEACDVIYGVQQKRKGNWFESWSGQWFYRIFNALAGLKLPDNLVTARLMSRRYVDALLSHKEREVLIAGLWQITGFQQNPKKVTKHSTSQTTYTFRKKLAHLINAITSFSNQPLIGIFYMGLLISFFDLIYIGFLVFNWLFFSTPLNGWTSVMASIWLLGGMIISFVGVIGIYLSKIFSEVKQRPYTIVRHIYQYSPEDKEEK